MNSNQCEFKFEITVKYQDEFHFRWLNIKGFDAASHILIMLFFNHLNWNWSKVKKQKFVCWNIYWTEIMWLTCKWPDFWKYLQGRKLIQSEARQLWIKFPIWNFEIKLNLTSQIKLSQFYILWPFYSTWSVYYRLKTRRSMAFKIYRL